MDSPLKKQIENLENGQHPTFLECMEMLSEVTQTFTLDNRPAANAETISICELNGHVCSQ